MNVLNIKPLLAILLTITVGAVGCSTELPVGSTALQGSKMLAVPDQIAQQTASTDAETVGKPTVQSTTNQAENSQTETIAQASYSQPVAPIHNASATAPLTTLGLDDDIFEMVEQANGVVLLDFYADWCGPCRMQGGILHEMEDTASQNDASIIKVDVDQHRQLASALNVTALPTLVLIKDGKIVERQTGLADRQRIADLLSM